MRVIGLIMTKVRGENVMEKQDKICWKLHYKRTTITLVWSCTTHGIHPRRATHVLSGKTPSGETLNRWTRHGKTSVLRHWTEKRENDGLPGVKVTGGSKV